MGSHSFCANLTHFEVGSHSSEAADLDWSGLGRGPQPEAATTAIESIAYMM